MKKTFFISLIFIIYGTNLFAEQMQIVSEATKSLADNYVSISGTVSNTIWTKNDSPYHITGDVNVNNLTIEEGVNVKFAGNFVFKIEGTLTAVGTEESPIIFNKIDTLTDKYTWQGILFDHSSSGSHLKHCLIENSINSGIRIIDSNPLIENCAIVNNFSDDIGGGMRITLNSLIKELIIKNCTITSNSSSVHGGGLYINASNGSLTLQNCKINNNRANPNHDSGNYYGGGIYCESAASNLFLINCDIRDNSALSKTTTHAYCYGGGLYFKAGNVKLFNCNIESNSTYPHAIGGGTNHAHSYGAGIFQENGSLIVKNCIISSNSPKGYGQDGSYERGSGIYTNNASVILENSTVAYNTNEGIRNSNGIVTILNSIIYFNSDSQIVGNATVNFSNIQGGWAEGEGNIDLNPYFESIQNLHIDLDSPCIDAGSTRIKYNDLCFLPNGPSYGSGRNDMGAHGGPGACGYPPHPNCSLLKEYADACGITSVSADNCCDEYNVLSKQYNELSYEYNSLSQTYLSLTFDYSELSKSYDILSNEYESLSSSVSQRVQAILECCDEDKDGKISLEEIIKGLEKLVGIQKTNR